MESGTSQELQKTPKQRSILPLHYAYDRPSEVHAPRTHHLLGAKARQCERNTDNDTI
jgi:hypothetical protein